MVRRTRPRRAAMLTVAVLLAPLLAACSSGSTAIPASAAGAGRVHAGSTESHRAAGAVAKNCFAAPGVCGYPDPRHGNVGPPQPCAALPSSGSITTSSAGQTIENVDIRGQLIIRNPGVTVNNVCVIYDGRARPGSTAVQITGPAAANPQIENSIIAGANSSSGSVQIAASNWGAPGALLSRDYIYNCGECIHDEPWTVADSYVVANGMEGTGDHTEPIYINDGTLSAVHDTLLLPPHRSPQVAVVFTNVNDGNGGPCRDHVTISDSLLAGGGFPLMLCAHGTSGGSSTMHIVGNRFARCTTRPLAYDPQTGGIACAGYRRTPETAGGAGSDLHGYWPNGGYYGLATGVRCAPRHGQVWAANIWDDTRRAIRCP